MKTRIFLLIAAATLANCGIGNIDRNNASDPKASNYSGGSGSGGSGGGGGTGSGSGTFNLEVPIEMVDYGLQGNGAVQNFTQTYTAFDTSEYDGTLSYFFEIVAQNTSGAAHTLQLLDTPLNVCASISIPTSAATPTRIRSAFTPVVASSVYTVNFSTLAPATVRVFAARILVQQTNATKTRIYLPLISGNQGATQVNAAGSVTTVGSPGVGRDTAHDVAWLYQASRYPNLAASNPFTFDVVMAVSGGATIQHNLEDVATNPVAASNLSTTLAAPTRLSVNLSAAAFTNGTTYRVAYSGPSGGQTSNLFHAGLWIRLTNLTQVETYYRMMDSTTATGGPFDNRRVLIDFTKFSNPLSYFEITGNGSNNTISLSDVGVTDSGTGGAVSVSGSSISTGLTHASVRSAAINLTSGNRYIGSGVASSPTQFVVVVARTP